MEKTSTLFDEMIHILLRCVVHLRGHWNKMVPFMKPFIFADFSNGTKFCSYIYWSINDIQSHHLLHWANTITLITTTWSS
jgi:hypothetical protein